MSQGTPSPIINELLTKPSQVAPTLFVGLGGAGCRMVARVFDQLKRRPDYDERFKQLVKFAYVDTNINDLENYREKADDLFLISDFEKAEYSKLAGGKAYLDADDYFTQWVPGNYRFRTGDTAGAGQIRIESRLGVYYQIKHNDFGGRMRQLIEKLKDHAHGHRRLDNAEIRIFICYSVAGGTGSGAHLPVAYLLRDIGEQFGKPLLFGVAALPSVFEDKVGTNKDGVFANGYAALKETEYLMKLGAPESRFFPEDGRRVFHYNPADRTKRTVTAKPFDTLWVVDRPESFSVKDVLQAAGDTLFLQLFTPIYGEQAGDFDNYTQHQRFLVPHDFEAKNIPGYTSFYGAFGAAVLHVPHASLLNYCARRGGLAVVENSFLQGIPGGAVYRRLSDNSFSFFEVDALDRSGKRIKEAEFDSRPPGMREHLRNRLFQKRVNLLAHAEIEADGSATFFKSAFFHGHGARALPQSDGSAKHVEITSEKGVLSKDEEALKLFREDFQKSNNKLSLSMGHFPLNALSGKPGAPPSWECQLTVEALAAVVTSLQAEADAWIKSRASETEDPDSLWGKYVTQEQVEKEISRKELNDKVDELVSSARKAIANQLNRSEPPSTIPVEWVPGFAWLNELSFLTGPGAIERNLVEKRYAVLTVLDRVDELVLQVNDVREAKRKAAKAAKPAAGQSDAAKGDGEDDEEKTYPADEANILLKSLIDKQIQQLREGLIEEFGERLIVLQKKLRAFARVFTELQSQFESFKRREIDEAERLRIKGDLSDTDRFLLDGEALQMESGRRMWDFYFEDQIRSMGALDLTDEKNKVLAKLVTDYIERLAGLQQRGEGVPADALINLHKMINGEIANALRTKISGDIRSRVEHERHGLSLDEALAMEVRYRALYLSFRERIDHGTPATVNEVVTGNRSGLDAVNVKEAVHVDYLRDKVKRLLKERSDLLCYFDEKHLKQGGVRDNKVFLAALHGDLKKGILSDVLTEGGLGLQPPKTIDFEDRKMMVFYRAVLNVPLYVFGRMRELRANYQDFKGMAKRAKVLHIDKNWEDTLPDLDPEVEEEKHRQKRIRDSVLDFATLLSSTVGLIDDAFSQGPAADPRLAIDRNATCIRWRERGGDSPMREWVLRLPLSVRVRRLTEGLQESGGLDSLELSDQSLKEEVQRLHTRVDADEPLIGDTISEAVLRLQAVLADNPLVYREYVDTCKMVRAGLSPALIKSLVRLPNAWRTARENLRNRYGARPTQEQVRNLDDLENVAAKLGEALVKLHEVLDLRVREEDGLREASKSVEEVLATPGAADHGHGLPTPRSEEQEADMVVRQSVRILQDFKNFWRGEPSTRERNGSSRLFKPLPPEQMQKRMGLNRR